MTVTSSARTDSADWVLCPACFTPLYGRQFARELHVCIECGRHDALSAPARLAQLADDGAFAVLTAPVTPEDPLRFTDTKAYRDRLATARAATGLDEAVVCARLRIGGVPLIAAVMDFRFLGGSLGTAAGERITLAAETALARRLPLLVVTASGGARMQEGALALMQMAKTAAALRQLDEAGLLTVSLITDPTFGGVAASFATLTDVILAEPGARLGFAGRRVIEQTIRQQLPPEFQTAEFLLEHGFVDLIVPRARLRAELGKLLRAATGAGGYSDLPEPRDPALDARASVVERDAEALPDLDPWRQVGLARELGRPTTLDYLALAFEDFQELHGDRVGGRCPAIVGGTARLAGRPVMVIGHQKGQTADELTKRNFGMPNPEGYRTAARLMRLADKLRLPVITLVDTPGAHPGAEAEQRGQAVAIAENLKLMAGLRVPVISVVIGEGGSGGALALAVANRVLMFENAIYSVISPEGCASIIWKDSAAAKQAASALRVDAVGLLRLGVIDGVLPERDGSAADAPLAAAEILRAALCEELCALDGLTDAELAADRQARFRRFGAE